MNKAIRNSNDLQLVLNTLGRQAFDRTIERLLDELMDIIWADVYGNTTKDGWYHRTYDLTNRENWSVDKSYKYRDLVASISFDENKFSHFPYDGWVQHGTEDNEITADTLIGVLNGDINMSDAINLSKWSVDKKPFWDDFMDFCKDHFNEYLLEEMANVGLQVTK